MNTHVRVQDMLVNSARKDHEGSWGCKGEEVWDRLYKAGEVVKYSRRTGVEACGE